MQSGIHIYFIIIQLLTRVRSGKIKSELLTHKIRKKSKPKFNYIVTTLPWCGLRRTLANIFLFSYRTSLPNLIVMEWNPLYESKPFLWLSSKHNVKKCQKSPITSEIFCPPFCFCLVLLRASQHYVFSAERR